MITDEQINERCAAYGNNITSANRMIVASDDQVAAYDFAQGAYWMRDKARAEVADLKHRNGVLHARHDRVWDVVNAWQRDEIKAEDIPRLMVEALTRRAD